MIRGSATENTIINKPEFNFKYIAAVAAVANADAVAAAAGVQSVIKANPCNFNDN